jgi:hypothetical protein
MRFRHWTNVAALAMLIAAYYAAYAAAQAQADKKAAAVIADVRKALGGEQKVAAMKGVALRADYRREMGGGPGGGGGGMIIMMGGGGGAGSMSSSSQQSGKIEIDLDLPGKYLKSDIGAGGFALTRTEGFDGTRPFLEVAPSAPGIRIQVDNPSADPARAAMALKRSNADLARLMLGLTCSTQPGFAAAFAYGGQAESPDGKADIIDVTGPDDFKARLFIDTETHLPLMVSYMDAEPRLITRTMEGPAGRRGGDGHGAVVTAGGAPPPGARGDGPPQLTQEQRDALDKQIKEAEAAPPKMIEYRIYFSDYRKVDGVSLPYRIARGTGNKTTEEWDITSYKVNPAFKADRFKAGS